MSEISANLERVRARMAEALVAAGRRDAVTLIAVSKTYPIDTITDALRVGQTVFGESTAQEALPKIEYFRRESLNWHFIGHLQSNKAKHVPGNFAWLHSLDSLALAQRLSRLAQAQQAQLNVLIEVNVTRDPAKHGVIPDQLFPLLDQLLAQPLPGIHLRGLMTIGPHAVPTTESRRVFAALRELRDQTKTRFALPSFDMLSMGMSDDYPEAILEGSTMIRVGTAIFGQRNYSKSISK